MSNKKRLLLDKIDNVKFNIVFGLFLYITMVLREKQELILQVL